MGQSLARIARPRGLTAEGLEEEAAAAASVRKKAEEENITTPDLTELTYRFNRGEWDALPDFTKIEPEGTGILPYGLFGLPRDVPEDNIGFVYEGKGEYDNALEHYRKSLAIRLNQLGPGHPHVAISYNNIGAVHDARRQLRGIERGASNGRVQPMQRR